MCIYIHTQKRTHIHAHTHVHMHACTHIHTSRICMYGYIYACKSTLQQKSTRVEMFLQAVIFAVQGLICRLGCIHTCICVSIFCIGILKTPIFCIHLKLSETRTSQFAVATLTNPNGRRVSRGGLHEACQCQILSVFISTDGCTQTHRCTDTHTHTHFHVMATAS